MFNLVFLDKVDDFQRKSKVLGFVYGVIKKYGTDHGGYLAALITYYGFLSIFPILLVLITLFQLIFGTKSSVRERVITSVAHYFPLLSNQLQQNVHAQSGEGLGFAIGLILTLYGARGGVNSLVYCLNSVWHVALDKRGNFWTNLQNSMVILLTGGTGLMIATAVSGFSSVVGYNGYFKLLLNALGILLIAVVLTSVSLLALRHHVKIKFKDMLYGNLICAVALQILLTFGGLLMKHELSKLNEVYGTFAVVLGMIFWMYLLAQVFVYTAEANSVYYWRLWPRSIRGIATDADLRTPKI